MKDPETGRAYYQSARAEIIARLGLRDNVIVLYLAATGAIFGVALGSSVRESILLILPLLSLGAIILVCQHTSVAGALSHYCAEEIGPILDADAPQWDASRALDSYRHSAVALRSWGHFLLITLPAIAALAINWPQHSKAFTLQCVGWYLGVLFVIVSILIEVRTHRYRTRLFQEIFKPKQLTAEPPNHALQRTAPRVTVAAISSPDPFRPSDPSS